MIDLPKALALIFAGLVLLKVTGLIELSWLVVMFPFTIPLALFLLGIAGIGGVGLLGTLAKRRRKLREARQKGELPEMRFPL